MPAQHFAEGLLPYQLHEHADYLEIRVEGAFQSVVHFEAENPAGAGLFRVLLNYEAVTEITVDALSVAAQAQLAEELGYRVAVYAPRPALFGLSRQAFQLGHVEEGISAAVFTDLNAAREWLRTG